MRPADVLSLCNLGPLGRTRRVAPHGFTLIEAVVVLLIVAVLATFAWPAWGAYRLRSHRVDAHLALMQLQQHQARWRTEHPAYATADELVAPSESAHGHYRLTVPSVEASGYLLRAEAQGPQRADTACTVLAIRLERAHSTRLSYTAAGVENTSAANDRCWGL